LGPGGHAPAMTRAVAIGRRSRIDRVAPPVAWAAVVIAVIGFVTTVAMIARVPWVAYVGSAWADLALSAAFLGTAVLGAVVTQRHPRLSIGWIFSAIGLPMVVTLALVRYAMNALVLDGRVEVWVLWIMQWLWVPSITLLATALPLLFPDGAPPSKRWTPIARAIPAVIVVLVIAFGLRPGPFQPPFEGIENPVWPGAELPSWYTLALGLVQIPFTIVCFGGLLSRFRRSVGVERQQLKWFLFGVALMALFLVSGVVTEIVAGYQTALESSGVVAGILLAAPAVTATIAIMRYRLYDIDVLINRALVYGAASAVLVATYAAAVLLFQTLLRPFTGGSDIAVAASTLLVVALFQPVRRRVQDAVDRRFYRSRYDASRAVDAFTSRLRSQVDIESVSTDLVGVVHDTLRPAHAALWIRERQP
jgi:hypothetical protein